MLTGANAVAIRPGKVDRSLIETGCSARMAVLRAKGAMRTGDRYVARSIIGSSFECWIEAYTSLAGRPAIVPVISGKV